MSGWRRFRVSPDWWQILARVVLPPAPLALLAMARRRARLWVLASLVTVAWLAMVAIGADTASDVSDRSAWWIAAGLVVAVRYSIVVVRLVDDGQPTPSTI